MKYIVVDVETSIKNVGCSRIGSSAASPYCAANLIIALGLRVGGINHTCHAYGGFMGGGLSPPVLDGKTIQYEDVVLVGHNIGFDIAYIAKTWPEWWDKVKPNIYIWDTQQVAYILSGHTHLYPSLDEVCVGYGLPVKDDKIKQYWKDGVDTSRIPRQELIEYLEHDLVVTEQVMLNQLKVVRDNPLLLNLVKVKMEDLLSTMEMERNGMKFDLLKAHKAAWELENSCKIMESEIISGAGRVFFSGFVFNPASPEHVSALLFGGKYSTEEMEYVLDSEGNRTYYKSGAKKGDVKMRKMTMVRNTIGLNLDKKHTTKTSKDGVYSTSEDVLKNYRGIHMVDLLLQLRAAAKELNTYFKGYSALVWPDGLLHPSINQAGTATSRQSCSSPNLQNVTRTV